MRTHQSIGRYAQEGVEASHKPGKKIYRRVATGALYGQLKGVNKLPEEYGGLQRETKWCDSKLEQGVVYNPPVGVREAFLNTLSNPKIYLTFDQLMVNNMINNRPCCKQCDSLLDCPCMSSKQFGLYTPIRTQLRCIEAEEDFKASQYRKRIFQAAFFGRWRSQWLDPNANENRAHLSELAKGYRQDRPWVQERGAGFVLDEPHSPVQLSPRKLPWPGETPTPFGLGLQQQGMRVSRSAPDQDLLKEKKSQIRQKLVRLPIIGFDFMVTDEDIENGFLCGTEGESAQDDNIKQAVYQADDIEENQEVDLELQGTKKRSARNKVGNDDNGCGRPSVCGTGKSKKMKASGVAARPTTVLGKAPIKPPVAPKKPHVTAPAKKNCCPSTMPATVKIPKPPKDSQSSVVQARQKRADTGIQTKCNDCIPPKGNKGKGKTGGKNSAPAHQSDIHTEHIPSKKNFNSGGKSSAPESQPDIEHEHIAAAKQQLENVVLPSSLMAGPRKSGTKTDRRYCLRPRRLDLGTEPAKDNGNAEAEG